MSICTKGVYVRVVSKQLISVIIIDKQNHTLHDGIASTCRDVFIVTDTSAAFVVAIVREDCKHIHCTVSLSNSPIDWKDISC